MMNDPSVRQEDTAQCAAKLEGYLKFAWRLRGFSIVDDRF